MIIILSLIGVELVDPGFTSWLVYAQGSPGEGVTENITQTNEKCPKTLIGKEYDVNVTDAAHMPGYGIAEIGQCFVFIEWAEVGTSARIIIDCVGSRFADAHLVEAPSEIIKSKPRC